MTVWMTFLIFFYFYIEVSMMSLIPHQRHKVSQQMMLDIHQSLKIMTNSEQCCGISWRNHGPPQLQAATLLSPSSSCSYPLPHLSYQLLRFVCLFVDRIHRRHLQQSTFQACFKPLLLINIVFVLIDNPSHHYQFDSRNYQDFVTL